MSEKPKLPPLPPMIGGAREVSSFPEGEAVLMWPESLSPESVAELEEWIALVLRKIKRKVTL